MEPLENCNFQMMPYKVWDDKLEKDLKTTIFNN